MANQFQNLVVSGLGTTTFVIPEAGAYFVEGKISLPTLTNGQGVSVVVATLNNNAAPFYTGTAGAEGFRADHTFALGDVLTVVLSSAGVPDNQLNAVKMTLVVGEGV
jgi:hypothetical protein